MHLEIARCSAYFSPLNSSVILFSMSCRFLFPSRYGASTPKKIMLLTPVALLMKLSSTSSNFSACFYAFFLMMLIPTSTDSLVRVPNDSFAVNLRMSS